EIDQRPSVINVNLPVLDKSEESETNLEHRTFFLMIDGKLLEKYPFHNVSDGYIQKVSYSAGFVSHSTFVSTDGPEADPTTNPLRNVSDGYVQRVSYSAGFVSHSTFVSTDGPEDDPAPTSPTGARLQDTSATGAYLRNQELEKKR